MSSTVDLHLHTSYSDGTDSPKELIASLQKHGINIFAVCDHDTVAGAEAVMTIVPDNMKMICGVEFSCKTPFRRCHILGLGIDINNQLILDTIISAEKIRDDKLYSRLNHLRKEHNIILTPDDISDLARITSVGKPHIARILVRDGFAESIQDAIYKYLNFKGNNDRISAETAIHAIIDAGGIPVWAHPLGGEGERRLTGDEFEKQLNHLLESGIRGLECYYSRYSDAEIEFLISKCKAYGLLISGGSDYHGENKDIYPGQLSADNLEISCDFLTVLSKL